MTGNWNEYILNPFTRNNWRASLVPAAAVIPAPIAYIKVVAVKKLVVECLVRCARPTGATQPVLVCACLSWKRHTHFTVWVEFSIFYFEKIRVFKASNRYEYISME